MPGKSGLELVKALLEMDPHTKIVVLTGYGSIATAIGAVRLGATHYLSKPADADDIVAAFARGDAPPLAPTDVDYQAPSLARAEWEHINRVLSDCGGNISEAARRLGIHRRSLQRKLQVSAAQVGTHWAPRLDTTPITPASRIAASYRIPSRFPARAS